MRTSHTHLWPPLRLKNGTEQEEGISGFPFQDFILSSAGEGSLVVSYEGCRRGGHCDPTSNVNWRKRERKESPKADIFIGFPRHAERCLRTLAEVKTK